MTVFREEISKFLSVTHVAGILKMHRNVLAESISEIAINRLVHRGRVLHYICNSFRSIRVAKFNFSIIDEMNGNSTIHLDSIIL